MIYLIGNAPKSEHYYESTFEEFLKWIALQKEYQLDIETDVTQWWCNKRLITIQFGDLWDKEQWVLQWSELTTEQKDKIRVILQDSTKQKLIHNATFEYVVLRFHGITIENVYDTMNIEKVLLGGFQPKQNEPSVYKLADLAEKYLVLEMDKTEQTTFGDNILTESKVLYAAGDVKPLGFIRRMQIQELKDMKLEAVAALENEVVLAYADITYNGMELNIEDWRANIALVGPLIKQSAAACDALVFKEPKLIQKATELDLYSPEDKFLINWGSHQQKALIYPWIMPKEIPGTSKALLQKWLKVNKVEKGEIRSEHYEMIDEIVNKGTYTLAQKIVIRDHRDQLIQQGHLLPAGTLTINWNSTTQVLPLLQVLQPKLKSMAKENFDKFANHRLFVDVAEYKQTLKLESSYGEEFITQHVEPDGKVRTNFNQVLTTGRTSSFKPNMQNIPAKESVGNRYRNAFMAPKDFLFVDSDYNSQELVVIAFLSQDPVWMEALRKGQDLHSVCAELVYGYKWKEAADETCAYYAKNPDGSIQKNKCNCKKHKTLRNGIKSINFGLAYGMTEYKLAGTMNISVKEAKKLIDDYFFTFPNIGGLLNHLGRFGVSKGYIQTIAPFFRKRFYPIWKKIPQRTIDAHLNGIENDYTLASIERASKNQPIQGTSADIAKLSMVLIRWFIRDNNLWHLIQLVAQVHDQDTTVAHKSIAEKWKPKMTKLMEEAAFFVIPNGLLTSETNITERWSK